MTARPATEVEKGLREPQNQNQNPDHDRVEGLWAQLGPCANGELDLKGLQKGFRKIDHREDFPSFPLFPFVFAAFAHPAPHFLSRY